MPGLQLRLTLRLDQAKEIAVYQKARPTQL